LYSKATGEDKKKKGEIYEEYLMSNSNAGLPGDGAPVPAANDLNLQLPAGGNVQSEHQAVPVNDGGKVEERPPQPEEHKAGGEPFVPPGPPPGLTIPAEGQHVEESVKEQPIHIVGESDQDDKKENN
jgi:hypothetical protein